MAETLHFSTHSSSPDDKPNHSSIPVVMLHGWGVNSAIWTPFIEQLSTEFHSLFHMVTIDLPGFGANVDNEITPYSIESIAHEINQTIKQPAIYLGWSLGGLVATKIALSYPNKVLGLITVASSPSFVEEKAEDGETSTNWPGIKPQVLKSFHQQLHVDTKKTITGFLKIQAMGSPHVRQDIKQISELVLQQKMPNKATLDKSLGLLESSDYRQQLSQIAKPFLRLYGSNDSLVPKAVIEKVDQLTPDSEPYIFKQASHAPFISHLTEFNTVLMQWLSQQHFSVLEDDK